MMPRTKRVIFIIWATSMCISLLLVNEGLNRELTTECRCHAATLTCSAEYQNRFINVTLLSTESVLEHGTCYSILPIREGSEFRSSRMISKFTIFGAISSSILICAAICLLII